MTPDEFQSRYHHYSAHTKEEAQKEADSLDVEGHEIVPVNLMGTWCLMLDAAAAEIERLGLL